MIYSKGILYGATTGGGSGSTGAVFKVDARTGVETTIYSFPSELPGAAFPRGGVVLVNGALYGTTLQGGSSNDGTVFKLDLRTGKESIVHSFSGAPDGSFPYSALTEVAGVLYGTTYGGGAKYDGTVFAISVASGVETIVHSFTGPPGDGMWPYANLFNQDGMLYGTTEFGGLYSGGYSGGTVFALNPSTGIETILHSFGANHEADGSAIYNPVIYQNGALYGTAYQGGASNHGTVFAVDATTGRETTLYSFKGPPDAEMPELNGLVYNKGFVYGMTGSGGASKSCESGCGAIYRVDAASGAEAVVYSFTGGSDGLTPEGGLTLNGSSLYGTTNEPCDSGPFGNVFKFNP